MCVNCGCDCETIKLPSAEDGNGVVGASITGGNLILTLSDGSTINAGAVTTTANPTIIIHNDTTPETTDVYTPGVPTVIGSKAYTVDAGTLSNGDEIRASALVKLSSVSVDMQGTIGFYLDGAWPLNVGTAFELVGAANSNWYVQLELVITRVSNTVAFITQKCTVFNWKFYLMPTMTEIRYEYDPASFTPDFNNNDIIISVRGKAFSNTGTDDEMTCDKLTVEYYKKG